MLINPDPIPVNGITGLLSAFSNHPLVALGDVHGVRQGAHFVLNLLQHPDFSHTVHIIVVEFGNAYYQPVIDQYLAGEFVPEAVLRRVWWRVGGDHTPFRSPIYAQFFHNIRVLNQTLPTERSIRVFLGDPPVDTEKEKRDPMAWAIVNSRDAHFSALVEREVLARGEKALLIAGGGHFIRISDSPPSEGNVVQRLEQRYPGSTFVILPHIIFEETFTLRRDEVRALDARLASWPIPSLAMLKESWLGSIDAFLHCDNLAQIIEPDGTMRKVRVPYIGTDGMERTEIKLSEMVDALLYLGPQSAFTRRTPGDNEYEEQA